MPRPAKHAEEQLGICARCGNQRDPASPSCPHCEASGQANTAIRPAPSWPQQENPRTPPSLPGPQPPGQQTPGSWTNPNGLPTPPTPPGPWQPQQNFQPQPQPQPQNLGPKQPGKLARSVKKFKATLRRVYTRPPGYRNTTAWFMTGMLRNRRGFFGALVATWFNLPLAIFGGGFGLIAGGVIGYAGGALGGGSASSWLADIPILGTLLTSALLQSGGIVGLFVGAAIGALAGFLAGLVLLWVGLFMSDPAAGIGLFLAQVVVAMVCGVLYSLYRVGIEGKAFHIAGCRQLSRRERELIEPIVRDCAQRLGFATIPKILMDDSREPNAFAGARHIIITRGFLDEFNYDPEPLAGVIAHELTHWRNADAISSSFIRGVALPLYIAYNIFSWLSRASLGTIVRFAVWVAAWPLMVCIKYVIMPLQASGSRAAEFRADQGAVIAGQREGIRRVLARFRSSFDGARNGWEISVCATHPPNELRLEAVEEKGAQYPLPDADGPAIPLPVIMTTALARD